MGPDWLPGLFLAVLAIIGTLARRTEDRRETSCRQCGYDSGLPRSSNPRCQSCGKRG
jgi:hypothetical protein